MDITMVMSGTETWFHENGFGEKLSTFSTKLKHFTHGGVAVDVRIAALNI